MKTMHKNDWLAILKVIGYVITAILGGYGGSQI